MSILYRMPAEWERHVATLLAWPHHKNDWPGKFEPIPWVYAEIIRQLTRVERVRLVVKNAAQKKHAADILKRAHADLKKIDFHVIPTNRVWLRDSGPIFVQGTRIQDSGFRKNKNTSSLNPESRIPTPSKIMLDWRFNAWAKYPNHQLDDKVPEQLNKKYKLPRIQPVHKGKRVVLEGGSIDVNGKGSLLTTEECLLSKIQCRNPGFTRADYEAVFEKYLGITNVIWLGDGIAGDDTHGHVDDLARFTDANTVVTVVEKNRTDVNYSKLQDNLKRLKKARDQNGKPLTVAELPMPKPIIFEGTRLPVSYANFLIANGLVLVPTFNDDADRTALSILAELFPKHDIIGIHAVDLVWGFGTLHCMSQQEPL